MVLMSNLQRYHGEIEEILNHHDSYTQNRLFNLYTAITSENQREEFVVALIGRIIMRERQIKSKSRSDQ